jgi:hypothetical protein
MLLESRDVGLGFFLWNFLDLKNVYMHENVIGSTDRVLPVVRPIKKPGQHK